MYVCVYIAKVYLLGDVSWAVLCVAVCCNALQCATVCCCVLQLVAVRSMCVM